MQKAQIKDTAATAERSEANQTTSTRKRGNNAPSRLQDEEATAVAEETLKTTTQRTVAKRLSAQEREHRQGADETTLGKRRRLTRAMEVTLTEKSLASGSIKGYKSGVRLLIHFAETIGVSEDELFPPYDFSKTLPTQVVCLWIQEMIDEGLRPNGISGRISAVKWFCETRGRRHDLDNPTVMRLKEAARRSNSKAPVKAKPISLTHLKAFQEICQTREDCPSWYKRIFAIILLCFAGFLRLNECLELRIKDVKFCQTHVELYFPKRKGDRYRMSSRVLIARMTGSKRLCPVKTLEDWIYRLQSNEAENSPIWPGVGAPTEEGPAHISYTTIRKQLLKLIDEAGFDLEGLRSHSCRVGGATQAHRAGLPDADIAKHGDWNDLFTFHGYLEPTIEERLRVSRALSLGDD